MGVSMSGSVQGHQNNQQRIQQQNLNVSTKLNQTTILNQTNNEFSNPHNTQQAFSQKDIKYFTNDLILRIIEHIQSSNISSVDLGNGEQNQQIVCVSLIAGQQDQFKSQLILEYDDTIANKNDKTLPKNTQNEDENPLGLIHKDDNPLGLVGKDDDMNELYGDQKYSEQNVTNYDIPEITKETLECLFEYYLLNQPQQVSYADKFDKQYIHTIVGFIERSKQDTTIQRPPFKVLYIKFMVRAELYIIYQHIHPIYQIQDISKKIYRYNSIDRVQFNKNTKLTSKLINQECQITNLSDIYTRIDTKQCFDQLCQSLIALIKNQTVPDKSNTPTPIKQIDIDGDCNIRIRLRVFNDNDFKLILSSKTIIAYLNQLIMQYKSETEIQNGLYFITNYSKEQNTQQINIIFEKLVFEITIDMDILGLYTEISQIIDLTQICLMLHNKYMDDEIDTILHQ